MIFRLRVQIGKVSWKRYTQKYDSWEPIENLGFATPYIFNFFFFVILIHVNGKVHVICGGPPCQGISGFNRFRNKDNPLEDLKNNQLVVFMDIIQYLKPKYVLMENVVDIVIVKFSGGYLGRLALGRLKLPQFPLPTHEVDVRGQVPKEFKG
ncbi:hypothetical protein IFM89_023271 [Coptis chinensis]|uniref:DNA (cytosine-5-)-methyltransferase n=1 Tax=Coptis chinensis TaxID=261450 RepID=A0A835LJ09_9MAGN|nr:hypothetical protein IFM89_023271 [Coptis chinensis]